MNLLREKLRALGQHRVMGGDGGGGGGDGGEAAPSDADIGMMADIGMPASAIQGASNAASLGNISASNIGTGFGMATGIPGVGAVIGAAATLGNMADSVTGFGGGTPGIGTGDPGSSSSPGGGDMATAAYGGAGYDQYGNYGYWDPQRGWVGLTPPSGGGGGGLTLGDVNGGRTGGGFGAPAATPAPAPAAPTEDQNIRAAQLELVNQQREIAAEMLRRQNLLEPELLRSQGYEQIIDPATGRVTGYQLSATAREQQAAEAEVQNLMRTRTLAALKGELPVDPALNREIEQNRLTLRDALRGNLGSGFETSTPGIQALADFEKRAEELRESSRRDQLAAGEGIRLAGQQLQSQIGTQGFQNIAGLSQLTGAPAGIYSQAGTGLNAINQNILGNRQLTLQELLGNLSSRTQLQLGQMGSQDLATRLAAQDNAGTGQLFGSLATSLLGTESGRQAVGGAVDWFSSLF